MEQNHTGMKNQTNLSLAFLLGLIISLSSCSVIEGIFKAGVWTGILIVVIVVGLIIFILMKLLGR